ncbi:MAG: Asp23/Gls24 family envelope stress response protein [Microbacterium sp.]|uniref:Alkaline shock protein 23 n=1 Tax=Microbacterium ginsengisoli TaxID=400772 RepID=A0A0F0LQ58_9MICO|nr:MULTISPECIES: Asp23/Gls24 family envelope stress response protein [Microbacterium]MAL05611.1 Asp23/Gls24 family envelope stress response protein [Microbacterium sp.]MCK9920155.1 Asp23/Gls24 family envelope stress response protein [Microbacteriaceae bacterium K1510]KJL34819.1 Alkaline shock protein 23 [Microbacterium ginsengisoli]KJL35096.1 Alkaline shock protein 23 [Microbacterium ginsengisoli]MBN9207626.1 Asp23/Gls24 family envelope stress response protein [Microbacterium ginsengisoli]
MAQTTNDTTPLIGGAPTGKTVVVDPVVAKIVGVATRAVPGVHALGGGAARVIGSIREAVGAKDLTQGVSVEVGETEVAADISIVVDYPEELQRVAGAVRAAAAEAIQDLVGMKVAEVNVTIVDVHIPGDDDTAEQEARVQ